MLSTFWAIWLLVPDPFFKSRDVIANSHCRVTAKPAFGAGAWVDTIRRFEFW